MLAGLGATPNVRKYGESSTTSKSRRHNPGAVTDSAVSLAMFRRLVCFAIRAAYCRDTKMEFLLSWTGRIPYHENHHDDF